MSTYLGIEVLDEVQHNAREAIAQAFRRHGALHESPVGRRFWDDFAGQPLPQRSFEWFASGRPAIAALRAFLDARRGRVVPFWVPTYGGELPMAADALAADSSIRVWGVGYGQFLYPFPARRHLALMKPSGSFLRRKVTLVVDNLDGTETLTLDSGLGEDLPAATTLVSFLALCRLDGPTPTRWYSVEHAEASLSFQELPREVPA